MTNYLPLNKLLTIYKYTTTEKIIPEKMVFDKGNISKINELPQLLNYQKAAIVNP